MVFEAKVVKWKSVTGNVAVDVFERDESKSNDDYGSKNTKYCKIPGITFKPNAHDMVYLTFVENDPSKPLILGYAAAGSCDYPDITVDAKIINTHKIAVGDDSRVLVTTENKGKISGLEFDGTNKFNIKDNSKLYIDITGNRDFTLHSDIDINKNDFNRLKGLNNYFSDSSETKLHTAATTIASKFNYIDTDITSVKKDIEILRDAIAALASSIPDSENNADVVSLINQIKSNPEVSDDAYYTIFKAHSQVGKSGDDLLSDFNFNSDLSSAGKLIPAWGAPFTTASAKNRGDTDDI